MACILLCLMLFLQHGCAQDISGALNALTFYHSGRMTPSTNVTRLTQCNGFSECYTQWTCGSPRDYLWEILPQQAPEEHASSADQCPHCSSPPIDSHQGPLVSPPMGMRSAVPLGGIGAGTVELRGDGTFADWMLEGQGTALATDATHNSKLPLKDEAVLGIYSSVSVDPEGRTPLQDAERQSAAGSVAMTLRTSPPAGLPGVAQGLTYSGAHPFSRLVVNDSRLPFTASLFAFSSYAPSQPAATSAWPAVAFSLVLSAPSSMPAPVKASLLLSLPLGSSVDTARPLVGGDVRHQLLATLPGTSPAACLAACDAFGPSCVWWAHSGPGRPNATLANSDCPGGDIMTPPRIAVASLADCAAQCLQHVPGCVGVVYDQIVSEQVAQCGNTNASLSCCLPKSACSSTVPKGGDTVWIQGQSGNICTLYWVR